MKWYNFWIVLYSLALIMAVLTSVDSYDGPNWLRVVSYITATFSSFMSSVCYCALTNKIEEQDKKIEALERIHMKMYGGK